MTLPAPILDDRSYEQLRDELMARISGLPPGVDRPRPQRPGHHAAGAGGPSRREPALPLQPDPGPDPAVAAAAPPALAVPTAPGDRAGPLHGHQHDGVAARGRRGQHGVRRVGAVPGRRGRHGAAVPGLRPWSRRRPRNPTDPILLDEYQRVLDAAELDDRRGAALRRGRARRRPGGAGIRAAGRAHRRRPHPVDRGARDLDEADAERQRTGAVRRLGAC